MSPATAAQILKDHLTTTLRPPAGRGLWHGGASPEGSLRAMTPALALWRPAPKRHCIWELALHIAYWRYAVRRSLDPAADKGFARSPSNWPAVPKDPGIDAWNADIALLKEEGAKLLQVAADTPAKWLLEKPASSRKWTRADLIQGIILHDAYHAAQIQLLKRLAQSAGVA